MTERDQTIERLTRELYQKDLAFDDYGRKCYDAGYDAGRAAQAPPTEVSREPHDGWLNAWLYNNGAPPEESAFFQFAWHSKIRKMAGDWADFRAAATVQRETPQLKRELICDEHGEYKWVASTAPEQEGK